ncbi:Protein CBG13852 [Caenorhabditis briggsae]|uniref:RING-type domain-containing protein n=4 Tax=Caenorhabditis briggsae TaxID=6238 RepID=A0AAE9ABF7_CAEBR|nr:Protein CBG13852 [Caenorhabditis briggsae]ULT93352.1 hypothetical protein L3Y34_003087 [Caenorhabditis briggsae]CAP32576.2 Protein CBG13852 [Caenorhabditis briggsae]
MSNSPERHKTLKLFELQNSDMNYSRTPTGSTIAECFGLRLCTNFSLLTGKQKQGAQFFILDQNDMGCQKNSPEQFKSLESYMKVHSNKKIYLRRISFTIKDPEMDCFLSNELSDIVAQLAKISVVDPAVAEKIINNLKCGKRIKLLSRNDLAQCFWMLGNSAREWVTIVPDFEFLASVHDYQNGYSNRVQCLGPSAKPYASQCQVVQYIFNELVLGLNWKVITSRKYKPKVMECIKDLIMEYTGCERNSFIPLNRVQKQIESLKQRFRIFNNQWDIEKFMNCPCRQKIDVEFYKKIVEQFDLPEITILSESPIPVPAWVIKVSLITGWVIQFFENGDPDDIVLKEHISNGFVHLIPQESQYMMIFTEEATNENPTFFKWNTSNDTKQQQNTKTKKQGPSHKNTKLLDHRDVRGRYLSMDQSSEIHWFYQFNDTDYTNNRHFVDFKNQKKMKYFVIDERTMWMFIELKKALNPEFDESICCTDFRTYVMITGITNFVVRVFEEDNDSLLIVDEVYDVMQEVLRIQGTLEALKEEFISRRSQESSQLINLPMFIDLLEQFDIDKSRITLIPDFIEKHRKPNRKDHLSTPITTLDPTGIRVMRYKEYIFQLLQSIIVGINWKSVLESAGLKAVREFKKMFMTYLDDVKSADRYDLFTRDEIDETKEQFRNHCVFWNAPPRVKWMKSFGNLGTISLKEFNEETRKLQLPTIRENLKELESLEVREARLLLLVFSVIQFYQSDETTVEIMDSGKLVEQQKSMLNEITKRMAWEEADNFNLKLKKIANNLEHLTSVKNPVMDTMVMKSKNLITIGHTDQDESFKSDEFIDNKENAPVEALKEHQELRIPETLSESRATLTELVHKSGMNVTIHEDDLDKQMEQLALNGQETESHSKQFWDSRGRISKFAKIYLEWMKRQDLERRQNKACDELRLDKVNSEITGMLRSATEQLSKANETIQKLEHERKMLMVEIHQIWEESKNDKRILMMANVNYDRSQKELSDLIVIINNKEKEEEERVRAMKKLEETNKKLREENKTLLKENKSLIRELDLQKDEADKTVKRANEELVKKHRQLLKEQERTAALELELKDMNVGLEYREQEIKEGDEKLKREKKMARKAREELDEQIRKTRESDWKLKEANERMEKVVKEKNVEIQRIREELNYKWLVEHNKAKEEMRKASEAESKARQLMIEREKILEQSNRFGSSSPVQEAVYRERNRALNLELKHKKDEIAHLKNRIRELSDSSGSPPQVNHHVQDPKVHLEKFEKMKKDFQEDNDLKAKRMQIERLIHATDSNETRAIAISELDRYDESIEAYQDVLQFNILKIKITKDPSDCLPFPSFPELSSKFIDAEKSQWEKPTFGEKDCAVCFDEIHKNERISTCPNRKCFPKYHQKCYKKAMETRAVCPYCQTSC